MRVYMRNLSKFPFFSNSEIKAWSMHTVFDVQNKNKNKSEPRKHQIDETIRHEQINCWELLLLNYV